MRFFFDLLYPSRCPLCDELYSERKICDGCFSSLHFLEGDFTAPHLDRVWFDRARSCFAYEGHVAKAVHFLKYSWRFDLIFFFVDMLEQDARKMGVYDLIMPVPLHWKRLWRRGYNQSALLARSLGKKLGIKTDCHSLKRIRNIPAQVGLDREERLKNVKGAFAIHPKRIEQLTGSKILLIDDVLTTGATVNECAKVLKKEARCADVNVITIARTL
jgi:ComF family protein